MSSRAARVRVAAAACGLLLLVGCRATTGQQQGDGSMKANQDVTGELAQGWRELPDVNDVKAEYVDDVDNSPGVSILIHCDGCDAERLADRVTEDVWTSEISPLTAFQVSVYDDRDTSNRSVTSYSTRDVDTLTQRYGERPVADEG